MNKKTANKIVLLLGLVVLLTTSAACIFIGSFIVNISGNIKELYQSTHFLLPTVIVVAVGVLLATLGLIGFFGCILEKKVLLVIFIVVLSLIFLAEISAIVIGFTLRIELKDNVEHKLTAYLRDYSREISLKKEIDYIQATMKCCGVKNYTDWTNIGMSIPDSCCTSGNCVNTSVLTQMILPLFTASYDIGCADKVERFIRDKFAFIILFVVVIIAIQIVTLVASCGIICSKKRTEYQQFNNGLQV